MVGCVEAASKAYYQLGAYLFLPDSLGIHKSQCNWIVTAAGVGHIKHTPK